MDRAFNTHTIMARRESKRGPRSTSACSPIEALEPRQLLSLTPTGDVFRAGIEPTKGQSNAALAVTPNGGYVIAWQSWYQDLSGYGVYAQRYDASGAALGEELHVSQRTLNDQKDPGVAALNDGSFVVVWANTDPSPWDIVSRRYSAAGAPLGDETRVQSTPHQSGQKPSVTALTGGGYAVAWMSNGEAFVRPFAADGEPLRPDILLRSPQGMSQYAPAVTATADGGFIVAWEVSQDDPGFPGNGIAVRRFSAAGDPLGPEFRVNGDVKGDQVLPAVAGLPDNGFVVAWQSKQENELDWHTYARVYDADGVPRGIEFRVSDLRESSDAAPSVAPLLDGGFVVVFNGKMARRFDSEAEPRGDAFLIASVPQASVFDGVVAARGSDLGVAFTRHTGNLPTAIYARPFAGDAAPAGDEFRATRPRPSDKAAPALAMADDGRFVVAWLAMDQDGYGSGVSAQYFDAEGRAITPEFLVNQNTSGSEAYPSVEFTADGFTVAWWRGNVGSPSHIYARRYGMDGVPISGEYVVDTVASPNTGWVGLAPVSGGGTAIVWTAATADSESALYLRLYDSEGLPLGAEAPLTAASDSLSSAPGVTALAGGGFAVTWAGADASGLGVRARLFGGDGLPLGPSFQVNTYTRNDQRDPAITGTADGGAVITWISSNQDGDGYGIFAQRLDASGRPVGPEFRVNYNTWGSQWWPSIDAVGDGFAIAWLQDTSGDIFVQQYDGSGAALFSLPLLVNEQGPYLGYRVSAPAITGAGGRAVIAWEDTRGLYPVKDIYARRFIPNTPPQATALTDISVGLGAPDTVIDMRGVFSDDETSPLSWGIAGNTNPALFEGMYHSYPDGLTLEYANGVTGTTTLTLRATDSGGLSVETSLTVTVLPAITGSPGDDSYVIRREGDSLKVFVNQAPEADPTYTLPLSSLSSLAINGGDGDDTLTLEDSEQSLFPAGGIRFEGGPGSNTVVLAGGPTDLDAPPGSGGLTLTDDIRLLLRGDAAVTARAGRAFNELDIGPGSRLTLSPGADKALTVNLLTINGGTLDLTDNALVLRPPPGTRDAALAALTALLTTGRNAGSWDGPGLNSSAAAADPRRITALAARPNDRGDGTPLFDSFNGQPADANSLLIAFSLNGDTNLDGRVNIRDYFEVDRARALGGSGWASGDVDHSGGVADADDLLLIDRAFLSQGQSAASVSVLPAAPRVPPAAQPLFPDFLEGDEGDSFDSDFEFGSSQGPLFGQ